MVKTFEAVYEDGVFKPLQKLKLPKHVKFKLTITSVEENKLDKIYETYYKSLTSKDIKEDLSLSSELQPLDIESNKILEDQET